MVELTLNKEEIAKIISTLSAEEITDRISYNWETWNAQEWDKYNRLVLSKND